MITAEIITIGNELLNGKLTDTNSVIISRMLGEAGIVVLRKVSVGDDENDIAGIINDNRKDFHIRIFSGGLGPTHDDKTKQVVCRCFQTELVLHEEVLRNIEHLFAQRKLTLSKANRDQALVPRNARILMNDIGTAPGLLFEIEKTVLIFLPAVPFELEQLMKKSVMPYIISKFGQQQPVRYCDFVFSGIGESFLYELLSSETFLFTQKLEFAFLPSPGVIKFRQTIRNMLSDEADKLFEETEKVLLHAAGQYYVGRNLENIAMFLQNGFISKGMSFSVAESCTGGQISHLITSNPGASAWFRGGIIAYSNEVKVKQLSVDQNAIDKHGAVSEEVVRQMAQGVKQKLSSDFSVAVSGIAGPDGGTEEKPVGTVWIAVASPEGVITKLLHLGTSDRKATMMRASVAALLLAFEHFKIIESSGH
jgi:nicotinamide-nucleotide amidase